MSNMENYQKMVNIIFTCLESLKTNYQDNDNINMINNLEEYKSDAVELAAEGSDSK